MLNAGMTMNAVAMNSECSTRPIRHLRQRFQATGRTEYRPRSERPRVKTRGQDRYIWNTNLRNRFQTATATAANTQQPYICPNCAQSLVRGWAKCTWSMCGSCFGTTSLRKSC